MTRVGILLCFAVWIANSLGAKAGLINSDELQTLYLKNGHGYIGRARAVEENRLLFSGQAEAGSVEYSFTKGEIEKLDFGDLELVAMANTLFAAGQYAETVAVMEPLYRQRARFFPFMAEDDVVWFQKLADAAFESGDYFLAVGVVRNIRPFVTSEGVLRQLDERELLAHYKLPLTEKTKALAEAWVGAWQPYGASAIGWYILAQVALDEGHLEESLWLCLRPIVFSSQLQMDYLPHCYALAIISSTRLEDSKQAKFLLQEMKQRGLIWPEEAEFSEYRFYFDEGIPFFESPQ